MHQNAQLTDDSYFLKKKKKKKENPKHQSAKVIKQNYTKGWTIKQIMINLKT